MNPNGKKKKKEKPEKGSLKWQKINQMQSHSAHWESGSYSHGHIRYFN